MIPVNDFIFERQSFMYVGVEQISLILFYLFVGQLQFKHYLRVHSKRRQRSSAVQPRAEWRDCALGKRVNDGTGIRRGCSQRGPEAKTRTHAGAGGQTASRQRRPQQHRGFEYELFH